MDKKEVFYQFVHVVYIDPQNLDCPLVYFSQKHMSDYFVSRKAQLRKISKMKKNNNYVL